MGRKTRIAKLTDDNYFYGKPPPILEILRFLTQSEVCQTVCFDVEDA